MTLPAVFQTVDPESPNFGAVLPGGTLRACLGHLNRVTGASYGAHLRRISSTLQGGACDAGPAPAAAADLDAFAQLLLGKAATEPAFGELYANLLVDLSSALCSQATSSSGPSLLDRVVRLLVAFVGQPLGATLEADEPPFRHQKIACGAFLGHLLRRRPSLTDVALGVLSQFVHDVRCNAPHLDTPPAPGTALDLRGLIHSVHLLCMLLVSCGEPLAAEAPGAAAVAEALALLRRLVPGPGVRCVSMGLHIHFLVLETLELAGNDWKRPQASHLNWSADPEAPGGPLVAG